MLPVGISNVAKANALTRTAAQIARTGKPTQIRQACESHERRISADDEATWDIRFSVAWQGVKQRKCRITNRRENRQPDLLYPFGTNMHTLDATYRRLLEAASFAARAHDGQYRKDGETPYASHPFRVCLVVRDVFGFDDPRMLITALLHDTIEDTTTDFDDLAHRYGHEIAGWVADLTKDKRLPDDERERVYLERLMQAPWQVQVCKLADIFDNLMDVTHLPVERQAKGLQRAEQYFAKLQNLSSPEAQRPIALVGQLIDEMRAG